MNTASSIHLLDTVAVVNDLPEFGLVAGKVRAVVDLLLCPKASEVEIFSLDLTNPPSQGSRSHA